MTQPLPNAAHVPLANPAQPSSPLPGRLMSMDAYRGFVMTLMAAELLQFDRLHKAFPENGIWAFLTHHQSHVEWAGCSLHDLIQPSFSFLVGVALPYSIASRASLGQSFASQFGHAVRRSLILVLLGIFLRSTHATQTYFTFEDTLSQIGLGYPILFLIGSSPRLRTVWPALGLILIGYWLAFVLYPISPAFDYSVVGVPANWPEHYTGLMAHFNKNSNLAWAFDTWFLNLFPRETPFQFNGGGYATLSFIPTLGTMLLGLVAGHWLRSGLPQREVIKRFLLAGAVGIALGVLLHVTGICPVVKRIWTPAWVLFSGGLCFWLITAFYYVIDVAGFKRWSFPLLVVGMNSIAIYCLIHLIDRFIINSFYIHFGHGPFLILGPSFEPLLIGLATLAVLYAILRWMYRRKLFIRI
jgi:predicted acyltransferase